MAQSSEINIVPKPVSVQLTGSTFKISRKTVVLARPSDVKIAKFLNDYLQKNSGFTLRVVSSNRRGSDHIDLINEPIDFSHKSGGYGLIVDSHHIYVSASDDEGRFNAIQSLIQLISFENGDITLPTLQIEDYPRFPYRGMHLDVTRHFMPVEFVKKYIDLMSQYKFNYFHWHLTDDQGWRIEIKKYPKLTEIGSKRPETVVGRNLQPYIGDKTPHEGFYTQDQIRDVVAYAKARYITVIPEIEMPGHSSAALAAYPELGCKQDYQYKVQTTWGIFKEVYCPTEKTFQFLEDVVSEVIDLFPDSPYIHVGGDEVLKDMWKDSPEVQELMKRENLKDVNEVQSYFIRRMEKFINSKGKRVIGWDEILEGGLAPNATVMSWRGIKGGIEAAKAHHDVIMTPSDFAYFDYGQGDPAYEPINIGNYTTLEKVYSFDPVPKELSPEDAKYIIGGQANVWTEYIATPEKVEYMVFPRMLALAEDLWTQPENKNFADFERRLSAQFARMDKENVNYRIPEPDGLHNMALGSNLSTTVELKPAIDGAKIYYTTDGSAPDERSTLYEKPIQLTLKQNERVDLKTIEILPNGRKSYVYAATILGRDYLSPTELTEKRPGVTYAFSMPSVNNSAEPLLVSGETRATGFQQFTRFGDLKQPFTVSFDGFINIPADGVYEFQTDAIWDARVTIDGEKLIGSTGTKDRAVTSAVVPLKAGYHRISLGYGHHGGNAVFRVRYGIKGQGLRAIGGGELAH
jgi:hexosaminidase